MAVNNSTEYILFGTTGESPGYSENRTEQKTSNEIVSYDSTDDQCSECSGYKTDQDVGSEVSSSDSSDDESSACSRNGTEQDSDTCSNSNFFTCDSTDADDESSYYLEEEIGQDSDSGLVISDSTESNKSEDSACEMGEAIDKDLVNSDSPHHDESLNFQENKTELDIGNKLITCPIPCENGSENSKNETEKDIMWKLGPCQTTNDKNLEKSKNEIKQDRNKLRIRNVMPFLLEKHNPKYIALDYFENVLKIELDSKDLLSCVLVDSWTSFENKDIVVTFRNVGTRNRVYKKRSVINGGIFDVCDELRTDRLYIWKSLMFLFGEAFLYTMNGFPVLNLEEKQIYFRRSEDLKSLTYTFK